MSGIGLPDGFMLTGEMQGFAAIAAMAEANSARVKHAHYWIAAVMYRLDNPARGDLDVSMSKFRGLEVSCYVCERPYSPELAAEPCPGDPEGGDR